MRILTFGWEFPPHISGGLGTACYGLTKALLNEHVAILFVVPNKFGDEDIKLISASEIIVKKTVLPETDMEIVGPEFNQLFRIRIPSSLSPYPQSELRKESQVHQCWKYENLANKTKVVESNEGVSYAFTGSYGPIVLDEVQRYGEVATEIAVRYSFDLIHAHDWLTYPAGIAAKKRSGKPLIIHVHATEYDRVSENNVDDRVIEIERKGMAEADKIIAVSQRTKETIVSKYNIDAQKVLVVYNGIIPKNNVATKSLPKISDQIITFLGRITYQKGPQYFISAARKVLKVLPEAHFIMAGSGELLPEMISLAAQFRISSRLHFTGFLNPIQIQQIFSISSVFVMPSVSEPFGIVPLEAAQADIPVIISNQAGVSEVMNHVIKIDFWDTDALASAIINVLKYKSLSKSLKTDGRKDLETLTWDAAAKKISKLYSELC